MKKQFFTIFVLLFAVATAYAQEVGTVFTANGINYKITSLSPREVEVTENGPFFSGEANIPSVVTFLENNYKVTALGEAAFWWCEELTSFSIPNSVTVIGNGAFGRCYKLDSVVIPNSVIEIGEFAFYQCYYITSITIGSSVKVIQLQAFAYLNPAHVYCLPMQAPFCDDADGVFYHAIDTKVHICPTATGYGEEGEYWEKLLIVKDGECIVGIPQIDAEPQFIIFPNPASSYFTLQIEETHLPQTVQMINLQGQIVQTLQITHPETKIDVSNLARGHYFVKTELGTKKLVID